MRNLIKNNYHRHNLRKKKFDESTIRDVITFYNKLSISKDPLNENAFHIKNWFEKKVYNHKPLLQPIYPFFKDHKVNNILPRKLTERIYEYKDVDGVSYATGNYKVVLTKECVKALPIKPGLSCKFLGKSPFLPAYKPQTVRREDINVYRFKNYLRVNHNLLYNRVEKEIPERYIINPGWASQQREFQNFL